MKNQRYWLPVAGLLLLAVMLFALEKSRTPVWMTYQKEYFAEQIRRIKSELPAVKDAVKRQALTHELSQWEKRKPEVVNLVLPNGKVERCLTCHLGIEEISPSHPTNTFGCTVCHGGNALSLDEQTAHADWYGQGHPGALSSASLSCGGTGPNGVRCHSGNPQAANNEVDLVKGSIMATKAGELSSVRRMLGLDPGNTVPGLKPGQSAQYFPNPLNGRPQQAKFMADCLTQCHLNNGNLPIFRFPQGARVKSTDVADANGALTETPAYGCETCHVLTNATHTYVGGDVTIPRNQVGFGMVHRLTTQIPYTQCNQCHNQGQHDPIHDIFTPRKDMQQVVNDWMKPTLSFSRRVKDYYVPGEVFARCEVSLDCIDCHTRQDVMGDGHAYQSEYSAVHIQCMDCHGTSAQLPRTKVITSLNDPAFEEKITNPVFPPLKLGDRIVVTAKGEEMPFVRQEGKRWLVYSRISGKSFNIPLVKGSACRQNPARQGADSCHRCHAESTAHP
ncbi:Multihaem cytochrome [Acididesulfobacillus acetoxydans]|uniref:CheY-like superfamily n=1 Tax=Acididesulfobacillus acetoxydans TaxID=1561005 RepID=A0A8S0WM76_9FIRM|nr:hypothetical protein [Acididesulfobacillus acetoxydans]CAA7600434.1 Multihaem cytochrome [Acididesulfobacillus acetoxydans]CEJ06568.1 CheY-like superfamily [Acididesulfobacillus acetoxydans]